MIDAHFTCKHCDASVYVLPDARLQSSKGKKESVCMCVHVSVRVCMC